MIKLEVLRGLKRGAYVQFFVTNTGESYEFWNADSLYLDEVVYSIFAPCFRVSAKKFNYYGPTCFMAMELEQLQSCLEAFQIELETISNADTLVNKLSLTPMGKNFLREFKRENADPKIEWMSIRNSLKTVNDSLFTLVRNCLQSGKMLWVLGI